jgi:hypothetical protein
MVPAFPRPKGDDTNIPRAAAAPNANRHIRSSIVTITNGKAFASEPTFGVLIWQMR